MKLFWSKTFRIGKLTVSLSAQNAVIIYRGRKKFYLFTFTRNPLTRLVEWFLHPRIPFRSLPLHRNKHNNTTVRKSPGLRIARFRPAVVRAMLTAVLLTGGLFVGLFFYPSFKGQTVPLSDEEQKDLLVRSIDTDYSAPEAHPSLILRIHRVEKGETLSEIARKYGVSMDTICGNNKLVSYDIIHEGTVLKIPNKDGILYTVKKGQTLQAIAAKYKIPIERILAENNIRNTDFMSDGDDVFLPDAKPLDIIPGFLWPAFSRRINCGYGWRRSPFNPAAYEFHKGIDIRANYEWIRATKYGKVTYTGWLGGYGKTVLIAHPDGWKSLYGHLSQISVKAGQYVKQGQYIGRSGNTGLSTGPHLHFELIKSGRNLNPHKYIR